MGRLNSLIESHFPEAIFSKEVIDDQLVEIILHCICIFLLQQMETYQITLTIKSETHPRKWIAETIEQVLNPGEDILDYEIIPVQIQENV